MIDDSKTVDDMRRPADRGVRKVFAGNRATALHADLKLIFDSANS
jgi:hypothetical protein